MCEKQAPAPAVQQLSAADTFNVGRHTLWEVSCSVGLRMSSCQWAVHHARLAVIDIVITCQSNHVVCSGETEAEENHPPRRLLAGRSQQPQAAPRRLLGGPSVPTGPVRIPGASPVPKGTSRRGPSRSIVHQDLLAPVMPGHESDEETACEAEAEEGVLLGTGGVDRPGLGTLRRRLGDDHDPRGHSQKGAAALRDVRDDFGEAQGQQEDAVLQGEHCYKSKVPRQRCLAPMFWL